MVYYKKVGSGVVQSVLLKRSHFPSEQGARAWAVQHGYSVYKTDMTPGYYHFRQIDPASLENAGFRMRNIPLGKAGYLTMAYRDKSPVSK